MRDQEVDDEYNREWCGPGRDLPVQDLEVGVDFVGFDRFVAEEEEDPDAGADGCAVEVEDVALEEGVQAAGQEAEGPGEEEEGDDGAVLGFEALEEWDEGEGVEEVVQDVFVEEGVGV